MGLPMVEALDKYAEWSRINPAEDGEMSAVAPVPLAAQNERSLRTLEAMMAGVG